MESELIYVGITGKVVYLERKIGELIEKINLLREENAELRREKEALERKIAQDENK